MTGDSSGYFAQERAAISQYEAGNIEAAERRLRAMLAQQPNDARVHALLALCRLRQDDCEGALEHARTAANADPDDPLARRALVHALLGERKFEEAEQLASGLAEDDPGDVDALFALAAARLAQRKYYAANDLFDAVDQKVRAEGEAPDLMMVARLRLDQWRFAEAEQLARRALTLDPARPDTLLVLAECALARKAHLEAQELALEALRLHPTDKETKRFIARASARANPWLRPFLPGLDWLLEMDRFGLGAFPLLLAALGAALSWSLQHNLAAGGLSSPVVVTAVLALLFAYALICYGAALFSRWRIGQDMKRLSLPRFWRSPRLLHEDAARRIARAEGADQALVAGVEIGAVVVEGDDRAGAGGVAVLIEHGGRFVLAGFVAEHFFGDQPVHVGIGLVQPHAAQIARLQFQFGHVPQDHLRHHRHHFLEHLAALLRRSACRACPSIAGRSD